MAEFDYGYQPPRSFRRWVAAIAFGAGAILAVWAVQPSKPAHPTNADVGKFLDGLFQKYPDGKTGYFPPEYWQDETPHPADRFEREAREPVKQLAPAPYAIEWQDKAALNRLVHETSKTK